jgi:hypothetical protein
LRLCGNDSLISAILERLDRLYRTHHGTGRRNGSSHQDRCHFAAVPYTHSSNAIASCKGCYRGSIVTWLSVSTTARASRLPQEGQQSPHRRSVPRAAEGASHQVSSLCSSTTFCGCRQLGAGYNASDPPATICRRYNSRIPKSLERSWVSVKSRSLLESRRPESVERRSGQWLWLRLPSRACGPSGLVGCSDHIAAIAP